MKATIVKVWIDNEAVYIQTSKGEIFYERFQTIPACILLYLRNSPILNTTILGFAGMN